MNEKQPTIDVITQFEQVDQMLANSAGLCGTYYMSLIKNNVPPELAIQLVLDWHKDFWLKILQGGSSK